MNYSALRMHDTRRKYLCFARTYVDSLWTTAFWCFKRCSHLLKLCLPNIFRLNIRNEPYIARDLWSVFAGLRLVASRRAAPPCRCGARVRRRRTNEARRRHAEKHGDSSLTDLISFYQRRLRLRRLRATPTPRHAVAWHHIMPWLSACRIAPWHLDSRGV